MDFLVLAPPVCTPAEPPSGAFLLAAGLAGHGFETGLLDLSLEFFHRAISECSDTGSSMHSSMRYLQDAKEGYEPFKHRSATGVLHKRLGDFGRRHPGWKLTLMDISFPGGAHDPVALDELFEREPSPFQNLWQEVLDPVLEQLRPRRVLVSLAYLSQLAATVDLARYLERRGVAWSIGGSLPRSLAATGQGAEKLNRVLRNVETGDGSAFVSQGNGQHILDRLDWPILLSSMSYLSSRPVIPLTLSVGCYWSRCLFCPDRELGFKAVPTRALEGFFAAMPEHVAVSRPIIHLLDSAIPPAKLREFLPIARQYNVGFYGFARPTAGLLEGGLLEEAASSGLNMLQLGVESGSSRLLERFDKGVAPSEAARVVCRAAELGVRTYLYLLFGLPGETDQDREATLEFVERNASSIDFLNLSLFNLPRHCELSLRAAEFEIEIGDFPRDGAIRLYWPFTCDGDPTRDRARRFLNEHFNPHPAVREANLRTPRWLRAAHLALMQLNGRRDP